jgi:hypothetical protein
MGLVVRFPLERARAVPPLAAGGEGASIHVLPVVSIERAVEVLSAANFEPEAKPRSRGGRTRKRTKRPA